MLRAPGPSPPPEDCVAAGVAEGGGTRVWALAGCQAEREPQQTPLGFGMGRTARPRQDGQDGQDGRCSGWLWSPALIQQL